MPKRLCLLVILKCKDMLKMRINLQSTYIVKIKINKINYLINIHY